MNKYMLCTIQRIDDEMVDTIDHDAFTFTSTDNTVPNLVFETCTSTYPQSKEVIGTEPMDVMLTFAILLGLFSLTLTVALCYIASTLESLKDEIRTINEEGLKINYETRKN